MNLKYLSWVQVITGIHIERYLCLIRSMMQLSLFEPAQSGKITSAPTPTIDVAAIVRTISAFSARPRYTFIVLDLITRVARPNGQAGPFVRDGERLVPIREWLASTIAPSATRRPQRRATAEKVRAGLAAAGKLPTDPVEAERLVDFAVCERARETGMTAVSRAVSELVRADLIERHYQGYRVDHENRGAQRLAVYTVPPHVRNVLEQKDLC